MSDDGEFDELANRFIDGLFGRDDPRQMPSSFFPKNAELDFESAIRADVSKQNFSVAPRFWYVDTTVYCTACREKFCWSAKEQQTWFEEYGFYAASYAERCLPCRREQRRIRELRQEYDRNVASVLTGKSLDEKERLAEVIDRLCESLSELPERIHENRKVLGRQIERGKRQGG